MSCQMKNRINDIQEEPQLQNIAFQWHQEEEQTQNQKDTSKRLKKRKVTSSIFPTEVTKMLQVDRIH